MEIHSLKDSKHQYAKKFITLALDPTFTPDQGKARIALNQRKVQIRMAYRVERFSFLNNKYLKTVYQR